MNRTFSSFRPCTTSSRLGLQGEGRGGEGQRMKQGFLVCENAVSASHSSERGWLTLWAAGLQSEGLSCDGTPTGNGRCGVSSDTAAGGKGQGQWTHGYHCSGGGRDAQVPLRVPCVIVHPVSDWCPCHRHLHARKITGSIRLQASS